MSDRNWAGRVTQNQRLQLTPEAFESAIDGIKMKLEYRMKQKGTGTYASGHEALGILIEEMREYQAEVETRNFGGQIEELIDIAVGCIWAIASITSDGQDW